MSLPKEGQHRGLTRQDVDRITRKLHDERLIHSCMTCKHFKEKVDQKPYWVPEGMTEEQVVALPAETCMLYQMRPPASIIAYGCESWSDDLPF